ncbi:MAG: cytochrome P450 [Alphaproteobacteria bacterium]|nr:cytochrome P450 [Alphaproteobacteria bacterium]
MYTDIPVSDLDLYSVDALHDPYPAYFALRALGPVVRLEKSDVLACARDAEVRHLLGDPITFSSASGVAMNDRMNSLMKGSTLVSDPPEHDAQRKILGRPLDTAALRALSDRVRSEAHRLVDRVCAKGKIEAVTEFAQHLPLTIVSELVGLPDDGKDRMLAWASAGFDALGPIDDRTAGAFKIVEQLFAFNQQQLSRSRLKPGGWADRLFEAVDNGELRPEQCTAMLQDYIGPSLDTTISATASAIWLFTNNPEQWDLLRANPRLISNAINEVVRIESPVQGFTRFLTKDVEMGGFSLAQGARILALYGSANRDERKWDNPDRLDIERRSQDQLGFGHGVHRCVGANLARLEISALLEALVRRVRRFTLIDSKRAVNSVIRGWESLTIVLET